MLSESRRRLQILKAVLLEGKLSTQDELREELLSRNFDVNQSTISRDLKRIGAIKAVDSQGQTVYRLIAEGNFAPPLPASTALSELVLSIRSNGMLIVINTTPGSASLVARHLDATRPAGILGTIAGDDTIFVAPATLRDLNRTVKAIEVAIG